MGLETFLQDASFGLRMLRKAPGFTTVVLFSLALGIGVNSTVFSVAEAALLKSWPARDPARLAKIVTTTPQGEDGYFSYAEYQDLIKQSRSFESILAYSRHPRVKSSTQYLYDTVCLRTPHW